jgi:cytochrome c
MGTPSLQFLDFTAMNNKFLSLLVPALLLGGLHTSAAADEALARSRTCMACHQMDRKVVGPSFKAIAAKYAGRKDMVEPLAKKIREGGGGVWGPVPMPANPRVSEADARKLAGWILELK